MPVELTQADRELYTILIVDDVVSNVLLLKVLLMYQHMIIFYSLQQKVGYLE